MTEQLRSGLIAGLIAAVIWMIITVLVGMSKAAIVGGGLAFLVGRCLFPPRSPRSSANAPDRADTDRASIDASGGVGGRFAEGAA